MAMLVYRSVMAIELVRFKTSRPWSSCVAAAELDPVKSLRKIIAVPGKNKKQQRKRTYLLNDSQICLKQNKHVSKLHTAVFRYV